MADLGVVALQPKGAHFASGTTSVTGSFGNAAPSQNDWMVFCISLISGQICPTPTGWTAVSTSATAKEVQIFKKLAGASESQTMPAITITSSGGNWAAFTVVDSSGIDTFSVDTTAQSSAVTVNSKAATPTAANRLAVAFFATGSTGSFTPSAAAGTTLDTSGHGTNFAYALSHNNALSGSGATQVPVTWSAATADFTATILFAPNVPVASPTSRTFSDPASSTQTVTISSGNTPYNTTVGTSNASVATAVLSGTTVTITPVGTGTCTLTVTDADSQTCTISVTVGTALSLSPTTLTFSDPASATQTVTGSNGATAYTAASSNTGVATVSGSSPTFTVSPVAFGTCNITLTDADGETAVCAVTVHHAVQVSPTTLTFNDPASATQTVTGNYGHGPYTPVSSNTSIATVSGSSPTFTITPVAAGTCNITLTDTDSETAVCAVTVGAALSLSPTTLTFNDPASATQTVTGSNGATAYTAVSSNTAIATVSGSSPTFTITPVAFGTCNITLTDADGETAVCAVTVHHALQVSPTTVTFASPGAAAQVVTGNYGHGPYTAASSNTSIATVASTSPTFTISPVAAGSCSVTLTDTDGETATVAITVAIPVVVTPSTLTLLTTTTGSVVVSSGTPPYSSTVSTSNSGIATGTLTGKPEYWILNGPYLEAAAYVADPVAGPELAVVPRVVLYPIKWASDPSSMGWDIQWWRHYSANHPFTDPFGGVHSGFINDAAAGTVNSIATNPSISGSNPTWVGADYEAWNFSQVTEWSSNGLVQRGLWTSGVSYIVGDCVNLTTGGDSKPYYCKVATSGSVSPLTDTTHWALLGADETVLTASMRAFYHAAKTSSPTFKVVQMPAFDLWNAAAIAGGTDKFTVFLATSIPENIAMYADAFHIQNQDLQGDFNGTTPSFMSVFTAIKNRIHAVNPNVLITCGLQVGCGAGLVSATAANIVTCVNGSSGNADGYWPNVLASNGTAVLSAMAPGITAPPAPDVTVTAGSPGVATLTVTDSASQTATIVVTVEADLSLSPTTMTFADPASATQNVTGANGIAPYTAVSSNTAIATVSGSSPTFTVSPVAPGTCNITLTDSASETAVCAVTVGSPLGLSVTTMLFNGPSSAAQTSTATSGRSPYTAVSSDTSVATVGLVGSTVTVSPISVGGCIVTVTDADGETAFIAVAVSALMTVRSLIASDTQIRVFEVQVYRGGNWVTIPCSSAQATLGRNKAGSLVLEIPDGGFGDTRSQLYEGEFIRVYRGVLGSAPVRSWTGFVDIRSPLIGSGADGSGETGMYRTYTVTDNIKELIQSSALSGVVYDGWTPNAAAADAVQRAINTEQYVVYDDFGNQLTSTAGYASPTGNGICYFPNLYNDDGTVFRLPQGTLASFGTPQASGGAGLQFFLVPPAASGAPYSVFEAAQQYFIASTVVIPNWTIASTATSLPPASGTVVIDNFNGIFYFNPLDVSRVVSITGAYYDSPMFSVANGTAVNDVIQNIWTNSGCNFFADPFGKLQADFQQVVKAPKRIYSSSTAIDLGVQVNRDRRNVILCLGWDITCPGVIAAKAVNWDDITNAPPLGLGKRAYMYMQDKSWNTMFAVTRAALYALMQVSKRGKIASLEILDDPTIGLNDVIAFSSIMPEINPNDFFYIDQMTWQVLAKNNKIIASQTLMGNAISGQGTFYLGPVTASNGDGQFDLTADVRPIFNCNLVPAGGQYYSTFSLATGLSLAYSVNTNSGFETITYYRSNGTSVVVDQNAPRAGSTRYTVPLSIGGVDPGQLVVVELYFKDSNGNIGVYRDWILAQD